MYLHGNAKTDEDLGGRSTPAWGRSSSTTSTTSIASSASCARAGRARAGHPRRAARHPRRGGDRSGGLEVRPRSGRRAEGHRAPARLGRLRLDGLHVHIGSQILDASRSRRPVAALAAYGEFAVYDLGGGLGERYTYDDRPPSVGEYLDVLIGAARVSTCPPLRGSSSSPGAAWSRAPA
jgi:diaminopimelate decarboxylase